MDPEQFDRRRRRAEVGPVDVSYVDAGAGPVVLLLHGVPLNSYHWRHVIPELTDVRRCIAPDLMGLGHTDVPDDQPLDFHTQARVMLQFLDTLGVDRFDVVGNDSGGAIAQFLAVEAPHRVRSLVLTNCDVHDNWPPEAFAGSVELARAGELANVLATMLDDIELARSEAAFGVAYENAAALEPATLTAYLAPITSTPQRRRNLDRYVSAFDRAHTTAIVDELRTLPAPALIVWGDDDVFFSTDWAHWLAETLPNARPPVILEGARLFFPEERPAELTRLILEFWAQVVDHDIAVPADRAAPSGRLT